MSIEKKNSIFQFSECFVKFSLTWILVDLKQKKTRGNNISVLVDLKVQCQRHGFDSQET